MKLVALHPTEIEGPVWLMYPEFVNKQNDSLRGIECDKEDDDVISFHISHQICSYVS